MAVVVADDASAACVVPTVVTADAVVDRATADEDCRTALAASACARDAYACASATSGASSSSGGHFRCAAARGDNTGAGADALTGAEVATGAGAVTVAAAVADASPLGLAGLPSTAGRMVVAASLPSLASDRSKYLVAPDNSSTTREHDCRLQ